MHTVLTIAGSDSSAGAGIQADLKTFGAHGVYGVSAITAVTAQNTQGIRMFTAMVADLVTAQIDAVAADFAIAATKIGMVATAPIATAIAEAIDRHQLQNVVLDPVLAASSGLPLLDAAGLEALRSALLPRVTVLTPNTLEAEVLLVRPVRSVPEMREAARALGQLGPRAVIVKGGHLSGPPIDVVFADGHITELEGRRISTRHTHGTGCTFSAALAARLAQGSTVVDAARSAKAYVERARKAAPGLGRGHGPLGHLY
jgi:hydroxymethylpyrimidine/phosphomethylpyrimidine kinase